MNILVLSDSHGNLSNMEEAVERERPQLILHLGDCWRDAERLAERYPNIPMEHVPGNCDCRPEEPAEKLLFLGDCRVLICHGHTYGVKTSHICRADRGGRKARWADGVSGLTARPLEAAS